MAGVNVDNVGLTYVHILDGVTETLNQSSKARNLVTQNYDWRGSHLEHKLHTARSHAVKFLSDGSAFPVADKQDYLSMKIGRKMVGASIQLTDAVMATAASAPQVALDVVASETEGMMKGILKFENFFFFRDGTGAAATVTETTAANATTIYVNDARGLWEGATYQVYNSGTLVGNVEIATIVSARSAANSAVVTVAANSLTLVANYKLYWDGVFNGTTSIAMTGLEALIDDSTPPSGSTFQGVTTASYPRWSSLVMDNGGTNRDLDPVLFRQALAGAFQKSGSESPSQGLTCIGSSWQLNNLDELYESELRVTPDSKVGGLAMPSFQSSMGKITMMADADAPYNKIFLADLGQVYRGVQKKLGWRLQNGQIFLRSDLAPVWTATAIEICEMYIKGRNSSARIDDLNETIKTSY